MANGLTAPTLVLHQAIHGYADGHRLLGSSIVLRPREAKVILTLSDASGASGSIEDAGYITGYPLPDAGLYALARTWPAPEMPRPGCVWTHTLLIDFADLAAIPNLESLGQAFVRPTFGDSYEINYGIDIQRPMGKEGASLVAEDPHQCQVLRRLLLALYGRPRERIFSIECERAQRETLAFALWSQQWPRLRRSFRFCTLVSSDRSSESAPFDLQFGAHDERSLRVRAGKFFDADRERIEKPPPWLELALNDLLRPGRLRSFLRGVGAELDGTRELFEPLAELYEILDASRTDTVSLHRGVALVEGLFKAAEARDARTNLVRRILAVDDLDDRLLAFSMSHLDLLADDEFAAVASRLGAAFWRLNRRNVVELLADAGRRRVIAMQAIASSSSEIIIEDLARLPELARPVLEQRRDLLVVPALWRAESIEDAARSVALDNGCPSSGVLDAMIEGGGGSLVLPVCEAAGRRVVLELLLARLQRRESDQPTAAEARWFSEAATPDTVAMIMSQGPPLRLTTLVALTHTLKPDDVVNDYGEDPVFTALRQARGNLPPTSSLYLFAWVLARAIGDRSRSRADLFAASFEPVYLAALDARLPDEAWGLLDDRLPSSAFWSEWDRGRRLRAAVLNAFVEGDLDPGTFGRLLPSSEDLFGQLASEASRRWGGRGYLRRVKRALREIDAHRFATRIDNLDAIV